MHALPCSRQMAARSRSSQTSQIFVTELGSFKMASSSVSVIYDVHEAAMQPATQCAILRVYLNACNDFMLQDTQWSDNTFVSFEGNMILTCNNSSNVVLLWVYILHPAPTLDPLPTTGLNARSVEHSSCKQARQTASQKYLPCCAIRTSGIMVDLDQACTIHTITYGFDLHVPSPAPHRHQKIALSSIVNLCSERGKGLGIKTVQSSRGQIHLRKGSKHERAGSQGYKHTYGNKRKPRSKEDSCNNAKLMNSHSPAPMGAGLGCCCSCQASNLT